MMTTTMTTARDRSIARLIEIREAAREDLAGMTPAKFGSTWQSDRIDLIHRCNRQIERLEDMASRGE